MNNIVYPMKVHAVKLEYRRLKLEKMIKGYFKNIKGIRNVVITFDPDEPKYNVHHPRTLYTSSRMGSRYSEKIKEYLMLKAEYDQLLSDWNSRYSFAPPRVRFPIVQFSDPHKMNNEYFRNQAERQGKYVPDNPTTSKHGDLKSKNELFGTDLLELMGIPFKYETEVYLEEIDETINPDCLINFYEIDRCAYLEILGMTDKIDYFYKTAKKIYGFSKEVYRPGREVIYVFLYDKQNFDEEYFVNEVLAAYDNLIPDDVLIWSAEARVV